MPLHKDIKGEIEVANNLSNSLESLADKSEDLEILVNEMIENLENRHEDDDDLFDAIQETISNLNALKDEII